jgi:hypothetical protein
MFPAQNYLEANTTTSKFMINSVKDALLFELNSPSLAPARKAELIAELKIIEKDEKEKDEKERDEREKDRTHEFDMTYVGSLIKLFKTVDGTVNYMNLKATNEIYITAYKDRRPFNEEEVVGTKDHAMEILQSQTATNSWTGYGKTFSSYLCLEGITASNSCRLTFRQFCLPYFALSNSSDSSTSSTSHSAFEKKKK